MSESEINDIADIQIGKSEENAFVKSNNNHFLIGGNCNERNSIV